MQPVLGVLLCWPMRWTLSIFGATSHILSGEETTELAKLLILFEYFILPEDRLVALSPAGERYVKTKKNKQRYAS